MELERSIQNGYLPLKRTKKEISNALRHVSWPKAVVKDLELTTSRHSHRISTIRLVIALAVQWKLHLHQIDISSAYLNDIYVRYVVDCGNPDKVLKLHKAITD